MCCFNGTSAASPHAAAAVALIAQANPYLSSQDIEERLIAGGELIFDPRVNRTLPRVNILNSVQLSGFYLVNTGTVSQTVSGLIWDSCWLNPDTTLFPRTINAGERVYIPVSVNQCVDKGDYTDTLYINTEYNTYSLPAELHVTGEGDPPVPTPTNTVEPLPTDTQMPTDTPEPTFTATLEPTDVPSPTSTVEPTPGVLDVIRVIIEFKDGRIITLESFEIFLPITVK
jgi:hypothetical protein